MLELLTAPGRPSTQGLAVACLGGAGPTLQSALVARPALGVKQALRVYERGNLRKMPFCRLLSICMKKGPFPPPLLLRSRFSLSGQSVLIHPALLVLQAHCWCQEEICCPALPCCPFVCPPHRCTSPFSSCTLLSPAPTPAQFQPTTPRSIPSCYTANTRRVTGL